MDGGSTYRKAKKDRGSTFGGQNRGKITRVERKVPLLGQERNVGKDGSVKLSNIPFDSFSNPKVADQKIDSIRRRGGRLPIRPVEDTLY